MTCRPPTLEDPSSASSFSPNGMWREPSDDRAHRHGGPGPGLALRRDRIMLPAWVYVTTALVAATAYTFRKGLNTPATRAQLQVTACDNPAFLFLYGKPYATSVGALIWRYGCGRRFWRPCSRSSSWSGTPGPTRRPCRGIDRRGCGRAARAADRGARRGRHGQRAAGGADHGGSDRSRPSGRGFCWVCPGHRRDQSGVRVHRRARRTDRVGGLHGLVGRHRGGRAPAPS